MRSILLACIMVCILPGADAVPKPAATPVILLKLDDLNRVTPRWQHCTDFLVAEDVKASYGVLCDALEKDDPALTAWVKDLHAKGRIEFWNHGYSSKVAEDKEKGTKGDWVGTGYDEQLKRMQRCHELARQRFGFDFAVFGPHTFPVDADTWKVMAQIPSLKAVWAITPTAPATASLFVFVRRYELNVEQPLFVPNSQALQKAYEAKGRSLEYISLQGHPNQWDDQRFEEFKKLVLYLKGQGCRFMTPSGYLATRG